MSINEKLLRAAATVIKTMVESARGHCITLKPKKLADAILRKYPGTGEKAAQHVARVLLRRLSESGLATRLEKKNEKGAYIVCRDSELWSAAKNGDEETVLRLLRDALTRKTAN